MGNIFNYISNYFDDLNKKTIAKQQNNTQTQQGSMSLANTGVTNAKATTSNNKASGGSQSIKDTGIKTTQASDTSNVNNKGIANVGINYTAKEQSAHENLEDMHDANKEIGNPIGKVMVEAKDYVDDKLSNLDTGLTDVQQKRLDYTFSQNTDARVDAIKEKETQDPSYITTYLFDANTGNKIDYTSEIEEIEAQIDAIKVSGVLDSANSTLSNGGVGYETNKDEYQNLKTRLEELKTYQKEQNALLYQSYYKTLVQNGATEDELNEFKRYVNIDDYNGIERAITNFGGSFAGYVGSTIKGVESLYNEAAYLFGGDPSGDSVTDKVIEDAEFLQSMAVKNASEPEKFVYEIYNGMAPFLYSLAIAGIGSSQALLGNTQAAEALNGKALLMSDASVLGSKVKQNLSNGYDFQTSFENGFLSACVSHMTEKIGGESLVGILTGELGVEAMVSTGSYMLKSMFKQFGSEAIEEGAEALIEPLVDKYTLNTGLTVEQYIDQAFSTDTLHQMLIGGLGGLVMGIGGSINAVGEFNNVYYNNEEFKKVVDSIKIESKDDYDAAVEGLNAMDKIIQNAREKINQKAKQGIDTSTDESQMYTYALMKKAFAEKVNNFSTTNPFLKALNTFKEVIGISDNATRDISRAAYPTLKENVDTIVESKKVIGEQTEKSLNALKEEMINKGIDVNNVDFNTLQEDSVKKINNVDQFAKRLNVNVRYDTSVNGDGYWDEENQKMVLNPNGKESMVSTFVHELTHGNESSKYYGTISNLVNAMYEQYGLDMSADLEKIKTEYEQAGHPLKNDDAAMRELVAIRMQQYLGNQEFVNRLVRANESLAYKILNDLQLGSAYGDTYSEKYAQLFIKAFETRDEKTTSNDIKYSIVKTNLSLSDVIKFRNDAISDEFSKSRLYSIMFSQAVFNAKGNGVYIYELAPNENYICYIDTEDAEITTLARIDDKLAKSLEKQYGETKINGSSSARIGGTGNVYGGSSTVSSGSKNEQTIFERYGIFKNDSQQEGYRIRSPREYKKYSRQELKQIENYINNVIAYNEAIKSGDIGKAQEHLDAIAKDNGYIKVYRGDANEQPNTFEANPFNKEINGVSKIKGYFSEDEEYANNYGEVKAYYIKPEETLTFDNNQRTLNGWKQWFKSKGITGIIFDSELTGKNSPKSSLKGDNGKYNAYELLDGTEYWNGDGNLSEKIEEAGYKTLHWDYGENAWIPLDSSLIKSADTITYDNGKAIDINERFNEKLKDVRYSQGVSLQDVNDYNLAIESNDTTKAQEIVDKVANEKLANAKTRDANGNLKHMFHGTGRADRVGNEFKPERATSGPMAFFTDSEEIANGYARDKRDTSLEYDGEELDDYKNRYKINGKNLFERWWLLPSETRHTIEDRASHVTLDKDDNIIYNEDNKNGLGNYEYLLEKNRNNVLKALEEEWLEYGTLFNQEERFKEVLKQAGLDREVEYRDPYYRDEKVYSTFLNITNPFSTDDVNEEFVNELQQYINDNDISIDTSESMNVDPWDKHRVEPSTFIRRLNEDIKDETTHTWTSIPDYVTDFLKSKGYDGIFDEGGKRGGKSHQVVIPFYANQIFSADAITYDNNGNAIPIEDRFDSNTNDIRFSQGVTLKDMDDYNDAIVSNDINKAQEIVDKVAMKTYPNSKLIQDGKFIKMWHHTNSEFDSFMPSMSNDRSGLKGIMFTPQEYGAMSNRGDIHKAYYLDVENMKIGFGVKEDKQYADRLRELQKGVTSVEEINAINQQFRKETGIDAFLDWQNGWYTVLSPNIIKSADAITYDDNGNVIPLEERFGSNNDIRYSQGVNLDEDKPLRRDIEEKAERQAIDIANDMMELSNLTIDKIKQKSPVNAKISRQTNDLKQTVKTAFKQILGVNLRRNSQQFNEVLNTATNDIINTGIVQEDTRNKLLNLALENSKVRNSELFDLTYDPKEIRKYLKENPISYDSLTKDMAKGGTERNDFRMRNSGAFNISKDGGTGWDKVMEEFNSIYGGLIDTEDIKSGVEFVEEVQDALDELDNIKNGYSYDTRDISQEDYEAMFTSDFDKTLDYYTAKINALYSQDNIVKEEQKQILEDMLAFNQDEDNLHSLDATIEELDDAITKPVTIEDAKNSETQVKENEVKKKKLTPVKEAFSFVKKALIDNGQVFYDLARKTKNENIYPYYNQYVGSKGMADRMLFKKGGWYDIINEIPKEQQNDFSYMVYHGVNIDAAKIKKPVFPDFTSKQSEQIVNQYLLEHPEWQSIWDKVIKYEKDLRQIMVDHGRITQATANKFDEMYPHYAHVVRVFDDTQENTDNRVKSSNQNTVKERTGGNQSLKSLSDAIVEQTYQVMNSATLNDLAKEYAKVTGTKGENWGKIDNLDTIGDELKAADKNTPATLVFYDSGDTKVMEIPNEVYEALNKQKLIPDNILTNSLETINNVRRNLITGWSLTFPVRNIIKDTQDVAYKSEHPFATYLNYPKAMVGLALNEKNAKTDKSKALLGIVNSWKDLGGGQNTITTVNDFGSKYNNTIGRIEKLNAFGENVPRLAEYMASLEKGRTPTQAKYDSDKVTTNFKMGGKYTNTFDKLGFTFLNASVEGLTEFVRDYEKAYDRKGIKGIVGKMAISTLILNVPLMIVNALRWKDDDDYQELSDYIKDNYYIVAKTKSGKFIRIPKGRIAAAYQNVLETIYGNGKTLISSESATEKAKQMWEDSLESIAYVWENIGVNNPMTNNILSPIVDVLNNKTWYGEDLLSEYELKKDASEQYDYTTDLFSRWVGQNLNISPIKLNYLLDQYSGGIGDVVLPYLTPKAETEYNNPIASTIVDQFTTDPVFKNQNISDFFTLEEDMTKAASKTNATDEQKLASKFMTSIKYKMFDLYGERADIYNDDSLSTSQKYKKASAIQEQINEIAKSAIATYDNVDLTETYGEVNGIGYHKDSEGIWQKVEAETLDEMDSLDMTTEQKSEYYDIKNIASEFKGKEDKKENIYNAINNSSLTDEQKNYVYDNYYDSTLGDNINNLDISDSDKLELKYTISEASGVTGTNGKAISNSKALEVADAYADKGILDDVFTYIKENNVDPSTMGLSKTVYGYTYSQMAAKYKEIFGQDFGGEGNDTSIIDSGKTTSSTTSETKLKNALLKYAKALGGSGTSYYSDVNSILSNMTTKSDAEKKVEEILNKLK